MADKKRKRGSKSSNEIPASSKGYIFKCEECDAVFRGEALLKIHMCHHGGPFPDSINGLYSCPGCRLTINNKSDLVVHVDRHRKKEIKETANVPCSQCDKMFVSEGSLQLHFRQMHVKGAHEILECEVCEQKLKSKAAYVSHMKVKH